MMSHFLMYDDYQGKA